MENQMSLFDKSMEEALNRHRIVAPLLRPGLEAAELREIREEILLKEQISERTLRRFMAAYRENKLEGLKPQTRCDKGDVRSIPALILAEAMELKEELPYRSARRIIEILEKEKKVAPGVLAVSTLSRQLHQAGLTTQAIKKKNHTGSETRRFQKPNKGMLWQADIKYGPSLKDPENPGKMRKTYLLLFIDDATRFTPHGEFYFHQRLPILEDCFRKALISHGIPDCTYVDNGKIFVSKWFRAACAHLGVQHLATAAYSPESKGKIERLNRTLGEFLQELRLEPVETLKELNYKWHLWVEESYLIRPHRGLALKEGSKIRKSPKEAWDNDARQLRTVTPEECRAAFLWAEIRKVDKSGCFSLEGTIYEAGPEYIGRKIEVRYDPFDRAQVEIWENANKQKVVESLIIHEYNGRKRKNRNENTVTPSVKTGSRLLKALEQQKKDRQSKKHGAISYRDLSNGQDLGGETNA
jgi:putative transposase